ncbi:hypothetical protein E2562_008355 [Oryza meyeriana var. granulata]|uniref:Uncharacterized protein n=1 Tax=Oryza meyeriana var. granulata TaxID=110450 RepID=A0A6G1EGZ8_9ORYZ|nr:hypothetical protein E2562_008355 [Oryza meyeriana var. granulata]
MDFWAHESSSGACSASEAAGMTGVPEPKATWHGRGSCALPQSISEGSEVMGSETFLEILLAILLPPLGVFLRYGIGVIINLS